MTRLLICGSRTYDDYDTMKLALRGRILRSVTAVITGGMSGADALGAYWAYEHKVDTVCYGAQWGKYGSQAGPLRNYQMLNEGKPTLVVAFYDKPISQSRGTAHMVRIARAAGVPTIEVGP